jgi:hypothetical protein
MPENGYNPMRWNCEKSGCFNIYRRPKIEIFHDCFPGKISFGDVDGIVEINGKGLMLEWKSQSIDIPTGQRIMYQRLSRGELLTVIVLCGDPQTMEVTYMGWFFSGRYTEPERCTTDTAKIRIKEWVEWATSK